MRFRTLFILTAMLLFSFSMAYGQSISLDNVVGQDPSDGEILQSGGDVTFFLRLATDAINPAGITNGFSVYSPDGATWTAAILDSMGVISGGQLDQQFTYNVGTSGSGADTVGYGGFRMFGTGIPAGFNEVYVRINIGSLSAVDAGKQICLDSAWYPPSGIWKWATVSSGDVFPTWSGPHCWYIDEKPVAAELVSVTPTSANAGDFSVELSIIGSNTIFTSETPTVTLGAMVPTSVLVISDTEIHADFDFPCDATLGTFDVNVSYTGFSGTLPGAFTLNAAPTPEMVLSATSVDFEICAGESFVGNHFLVTSTGCPIIYTATETEDWVDVTINGDSVTYNPANVDQLVAGDYTAEIIIASDDASNSPQTFTINLTINPLPVIVCPELPFEFTICGSQEICVPLDASFYSTMEITGPYDVTIGEGEFCFTPTENGELVFNAVATNDCGEANCSYLVYVTIEDAPVVDCPDDIVGINLCEAGTVEIPLAVTGADSVIADFGAWSADVFSFYADTAGEYGVSLTAYNDCGEVSCIFTVNVVIGAAPAIVCPTEPFYHGMCDTETEACFELVITGADLVEIAGDPSATWVDNNLCFTPDTSGLYLFTVTATSNCGVDVCENISITITKGGAPVVTPIESFSTFITPDTTCIPVVIESVFGYNYHELISAGEGLIAYYSPATNEFCYAAPVAGVYPIIFIAGNDCGRDTIEFTITVEDCPLPVIACPTDTINVELCELDNVSIPLAITGAIDVISSHGLWTDDHLYFLPDTEGLYTISVTASNTCGEVVCDINVMVTLYPELVVHTTDPLLFELCGPEEVCFELIVENALEVVVSEGFTYVDNMLCFTPNDTGEFVATITATGECNEIIAYQTFVIEEIAAPVAMFDVTEDTGMMPFTPVFANTSIGTEMTYFWDFGNGDTSTDFEPSYTFELPGIYTVTLTVTDVCDNTDDYSDVIYVLDNEFVTPTDEWISVYCAAPMFEGVYMSAGDIIKAYDPDGVICGADTVEADGSFGLMNIYRDDNFSMDLDEGAEPGDVITFKINNVIVATVPVIIWTVNGDTFELCEFTAETCLTFELNEGWNLISWNIAYTDDIEAMLADNMGCVDVILSFDGEGLTYDPTLPEFSTLSAVDFYHGYWFRLNCPVTFEICGGVISPTDAIMINSGWNLVSYWPEEMMSVENGFASIMENLLVAYGYDGGAMEYVPGSAVYNTLTDLAPGFGYWVKSSANDVLVYGDVPTAVKAVNNSLATASRFATSRDWMNIYGAGIKLNGQELANGSTIDVLTEDGVLCGSGTYIDGKLKFTPIYGYDIDNEAYPMDDDKLVVQVNGSEVEADLSYVGNGARVALSSLTGDVVMPNSFGLSQNYPNPFNPTTTIGFALPNAGNVELVVFNIMGQKVTTLADGAFSAGTHEVEWNGTDLDGNQVTSGIYFYRLQTEKNTETRKMILMK